MPTTTVKTERHQCCFCLKHNAQHVYLTRESEYDDDNGETLYACRECYELQAS